MLECGGRGEGVISVWDWDWGKMRTALSLQSGISRRRKLCMVSVHSCHICRIWTSKEMADALKSLFGVEMQATTEGGGWVLVFMGEGVLCCIEILL